MKNKKNAELNILDLIPKRLLEHELNNEGLIDVLVPRFKIKFLQKLIPQNISPYIKANLDDMGSKVWELIDGTHTARDIADVMKEKLSDVEQIHQRVGLFLQKLYKNNFITFVEIN